MAISSGVARRCSGVRRRRASQPASSITAKPATIAVLITPESPTLIVVARSQELSLDTGAILKELIDKFGGRGGGKGAIAQGGGLAGETRALLDAAREEISRQSQVDSR